MLLEASARYALFYIYTQLKSVSNAVVGQLPGLSSPCFLQRVPCMVIIYQNNKRLLLQVMLNFVDSQKDSFSVVMSNLIQFYPEHPAGCSLAVIMLCNKTAVAFDNKKIK